MPPPPDLANYLHASRRTTQIAAVVIGASWILLAAWAAFSNAQWLGPLRALAGIALAASSTVCAAIWWTVGLIQRIQLDQLTAAADPIPGQATAAKPRLLNTGGR